MMEITTNDDLVRYVYGETTVEENERIEADLIRYESLQKYYFEVLDLKNEISKLSFEPSVHTVNKILEYSKSLGTHVAR